MKEKLNTLYVANCAISELVIDLIRTNESLSAVHLTQIIASRLNVTITSALIQRYRRGKPTICSQCERKYYSSSSRSFCSSVCKQESRGETSGRIESERRYSDGRIAKASFVGPCKFVIVVTHAAQWRWLYT